MMIEVSDSLLWQQVFCAVSDHAELRLYYSTITPQILHFMQNDSIRSPDELFDEEEWKIIKKSLVTYWTHIYHKSTNDFFFYHWVLLIFFSFSILAKVMLTHKEYTHTACIWKIWWYPTGPWGPCQGLRFSALYLCQSVPPLPSLLSFFLSLQYCLASSVLHSLFHFFFLFNIYIFHLQYSIFIVQYYSMIYLFIF